MLGLYLCCEEKQSGSKDLTHMMWWFIQSLASLLNWIIKGPLTNEISLYLLFRQTLGQRKRLQMSPSVTKHVKPLRLRRLKHTLGVRVTMLTEATFSIMETRWQWLNSFLAMHRCLCDASGPGDEDAGTREMSSEMRTDLSRWFGAFSQIE